jgi:hypothetical protein
MNNAANTAQTIADQLGTPALAMMGATNLLGDDRALQFKIRGCRKVTNIRIELADDDTYTVAFWKIRGLDMAKVAEVDMVYADGLRQVIEAKTGLYLSI